ncbi:hypothetical protein [Oceanidesulfovibrio marinus]|uniref:hypothetical protein n=1 Tax=Oceanidesulfovibrio marinus TaxID=370038 RepID=UPI001186B189|nr:hypothetical protein [Oceanidesulfovibrio marinus]
MRKTASTHWWILAAACCCMLLCATPSSAAESDAINATPKIDNVGFMKNPPKELVDRFPMCDAFLNVEWIDEERMIGFSRYSVYGINGTIVAKEIPAIIYLDPNFMHYDYIAKVYRNRTDGWSMYKDMTDEELKLFFSVIKDNKNYQPDLTPSFGAIMFERISSYLEKYTNYSSPSIYTLADGQLTVCIPYPGNQRMWIAEGKEAEKVYNKTELEHIERGIKIENQDPTGGRLSLENTIILDLNNDGKEDYTYLNWGWALYSAGNKYFQSIQLWKGERDNAYGRWLFPPSDGVCDTGMLTNTFWTTDGVRYFLYNKCDIMQLALGGE